MKEIIQKYLEEQCKVDTYLAEKYKDTLIDGCIEYINKMAREELKSQNGYIADEVVFHWAREYYADGIAEKEKSEIKEIKSQKKFRSRSRKYQIYLLSKSIKIFQKTAKNVCVSHFLR